MSRKRFEEFAISVGMRTDKDYDGYIHADTAGGWTIWQNEVTRLENQNEQLRARVAELDSAKREADALALAIWRNHYRDASPNFEPLNSVLGVITQIDNMVLGLSERIAELEKENAELQQDRERLDWLTDIIGLRDVRMESVGELDAIYIINHGFEASCHEEATLRQAIDNARGEEG